MEEQMMQEFFAENTKPEPEPVSRRQFLAGAVVGGAAGIAAAAGTGAALWKSVDVEAQASLESAQAEIERLQGLVDLYETLESVGLDAILKAGMAAAALPLQGVEQGAKALKAGLEAVEEMLVSLQDALPNARESLLWLEDQVSTVADGIEAVEMTVAAFLEKATDNKVGGAIKEFSTALLDNLPFGVGDRIRSVLDGLVQLLTSVDELVEGINTKLLEPMRVNWFSARDGEGLGALFVEPVVEHVLNPLEAHLEDLAGLADTWETKLVGPAQEALEQRASIQSEISRYKQDNGFL